MADSYLLTDGATSIQLASLGEGVSGSKPLRIGPVENGRQTIILDGAQIIGTSVDNLFDRYNELERLLHDAQTFRAQGLGRRVSFAIQPNGAAAATTYYVRSGRIPPPPIASTLIQQKYLGPFTVELDVEPFGRGAEVTLVNASGTLRSRNHITHRFLVTGATGTGVDGSVSGSNTAALVGGQLWQTNRFSTSPSTTTPAANHALVFASTLGTFDRLILGLSTATTGITYANWEYWNGSAWTAFTPASNDFLSGSHQLGVADSMGQVVFPTLSGWTIAIKYGITAYFVRLRVASVPGDATNLVTNPSAEVDLTDYSTNSSGNVRTAGGQVGSFDIVTTTTNVANSGLTFADTNQITVSAGLPYTFSLYARLASAGSVSMVMRIEWRTPDGGTLVSNSDSTITLDNTAYADDGRYQITATCPLTAGKARLRFRTLGASGIFDFRTDAWQFEQASTASPYFDGSVAGSHWNGTANASTSSHDAVVPVLVNGPVRSASGIASITAADVDGDVPALGLVYLKNDGSTALAGVRAALATSQLGDPSPPFSISLLSAATFVPTSGDNTVAAGTDAEATTGERVEASLAPTFSDAAQTFDGSAERASVTLSSADKIDSMGGQSFFIEVAFMLDTDSTRPQPLCSRWDPTGGNRIFWLGVDDMKLRGMVSTDGSKKVVVNGNKRLKRRQRYMATLEFDSTARKIRLYLDSLVENATKTPFNTVRRNQTTALRVAESVSYFTNDSRNGQDDEDFLDGIIDWIMIYGDRVEDFLEDVLVGKDDYNYPNDPSTETARADSANVRALYQMNDSAANTTITDSATTFAGAINLVRSAGNTNTNRRPGVLQGGIGTFARLVGGELPPLFSEEYAGTYRIVMMAKQATTLTDLDEVSFRLQLNVGDTRLQMGPPAYFPALAAAPSNGYYPLDMGTFTIPAAGLRDGHRGSGSVANFGSWSVFVQHKYTTNHTIYLDNLYLFPLDTWHGEYDVFDDHYESGYAVAQNEGLAWDARGPRPLVYQTTTAGLLVQDRNPYAVPMAAAPRLHPRKGAALFALGLRGDATTDVLYRVLSDVMVPTVKAVPRYRTLVGS